MVMSAISHPAFGSWCRLASLSAASFFSGSSINNSAATAQDRAFALLHSQRYTLTPRMATPEEPGLRAQFERCMKGDPSEISQLRGAIEDSSVLHISWGLVSPSSFSKHFEIELHDSSHLAFASIDPIEIPFSSSASLTLQTPGQNLVLPAHAIRALRLERDIRYDLAWSALLNDKGSPDDILAVRRPNGVLDELHGIAHSCSKTHIKFEIEGEMYDASLANIEGVVLARSQKSVPPARIKRCMQLETGLHRIVCDQVSLSDNSEPGLTGTTPSGASIRLALEPFTLDRSNASALTLHCMQITSQRMLGFDEDAKTKPLAYRLLTLPPSIYQVSGKGIATSLTINGPACLDIDIPSGYRTLLIDPNFTLDSPLSFSLHFKRTDAPTECIYSQNRFPSLEERLNIRSEVALPGDGKLSIHVPAGRMLFRTLMVLP